MDDTTSEIKRAVDIVDVIGEYVRLEPFGGKYRGLCPFHDDHTPSFQVDPKFQNYRCWACGAKGDVFSFVQNREKISFVDAKQRLADRAGIELRPGAAQQNQKHRLWYEILSWAQDEFASALHDPRMGVDALQYLLGRGLTKETITEHRLGFAPNGFEWLLHRAKKKGYSNQDLTAVGLLKERIVNRPSDFFVNRVMFPIRDERGRVLAFSGRVMDPEFKGGKYVNSPATPIYNKSQVLYGIDVATTALAKLPHASPRKTLVVMEGYTDCLMAYQHGLRTCVASCGTALTADHVRRLRERATEVVLMFDGDAAGQKATQAASSLFLAVELELRICVLPDDLDPCDFVRQWGIADLQKRLDDAPDLLEFEIEQGRALFDTSSLEGRRKAVEGILKTLCRTPEMARQATAIKYQLALNRLSSVFGFPEDVLRRRITELRDELTRGPVREREPAQSPTPTILDKRQKQVAQWLVKQPSRAGEILPWIPADVMQNPTLKRLADACRQLCDDLGSAATTDHLRERLDNAVLDAYVLELCEGAPEGEAYEQGLRDIQVYLQTARRKAVAGSANRELGPGASDQQHLELLKRLRDRDLLHS